jgi:hypothetical protein
MIVEALENRNEKSVYGGKFLKFVTKDLKFQLKKRFSVDNLEN